MRITKGRAYDFNMGGCNFCNRNINPHGETDHNVTKVEGLSLSVRFCDPCFEDVRRSPHATPKEGT